MKNLFSLFVFLTCCSQVFSRTVVITDDVAYTTGNTSSVLDVKSVLVPITQLLRFKLVLDTFNYDDIAIGFSPVASTKYNPYEDSEYLPGIDAPEGLSSFSSDGMRLSINILPLPKLRPLLIKLDVESRFSTTYTLERTELSNMPPIYEFWLIDKYKKDSLDIRANANYTFRVDLSDTASYGANRFCVVIRQNPALGVHLLNFGAFKATGGVQISWLTENEQTYTHFTAERSIDNGGTFRALEGSMSTGAANYSYFDNAPSAVIDLYQLKIVDLNGAITYSNIVSVNLGNASGLMGGGIRVYPNPSSGAINLAIVPAIAGASFPNSITTNGSAAKLDSSPCYGIRIINVTGRVIRTAICLQPNWQDDFTGLPPGTYLIQVLNNENNSLVGKATFVKL